MPLKRGLLQQMTVEAWAVLAPGLSHPVEGHRWEFFKCQISSGRTVAHSHLKSGIDLVLKLFPKAETSQFIQVVKAHKDAFSALETQQNVHAPRVLAENVGVRALANVLPKESFGRGPFLDFFVHQRILQNWVKIPMRPSKRSLRDQRALHGVLTVADRNGFQH